MRLRSTPRRSAAFAAMLVVAGTVLGCAPPPAAQPAVAGAMHPAPEPPQSRVRPDQVLFGTLETDPRRADEEHAAGLRIAHLELGWRDYEPREGEFSEGYAATMRRRLQAYQAAGHQVVLGIGLQYPPEWAFGFPDSRYVNQYGEPSDTLNLTFSQPLREKVECYIAQIDRDLGLRNFAAIRVGAGGLAEALFPSIYPLDRDADRTISFWAFDAAAQGGANRPPSIPPAPYPSWKPGERTFRGVLFDKQRVAEWYEWYVSALADGVRWQMETYRRLGYGGAFYVLMPGVGARPSDVDAAVDAYLDSSLVAAPWAITAARGAAWHRLVDAIRDEPGAAVYVSSVADGSGGDDECQAQDVSLSANDPAVTAWSAARWLSYLADRNGLMAAGENPAQRHSRRYGVSMMEAAVRQAKSCGFEALLWAHDANLYDNQSGVTLGDFGRLISSTGL